MEEKAVAVHAKLEGQQQARQCMKRNQGMMVTSSFGQLCMEDVAPLLFLPGLVVLRLVSANFAWEM